MKTNIKNTVSKISKITLVLILTLMADISYSQHEIWVSKYNGFDYEDKPQAMTTDNEGNIYITGFSIGKSGKDFLTIKYSSLGEIIWSARFEGNENIDGNDDEARSIVVDNEGNVYVTGFTHAGARSRDFCTVKYDPKGNQLWAVYFNGLGRIEDSDDEAIAIALDKSGGVIVAGNSNGLLTGYDFCTVKYNQEGKPLWVRSFDGEVGLDDKITSIKVDSEDNILVTGYSEGLISGKDFSLVKYSSDGSQLWTTKYNGVGGNLAINDDEATSLTVDEDNSVYVTGYSYGGSTGKDFLTIKYSMDGLEEWVSRFDNLPTARSFPYESEAKSIVVDVSGNIYVAGKINSPLGGSDFLTLRIGPTGRTEWANTYDSKLYPGSEDGAEAITLDKRGEVYVTGFINGGDLGLEACGNERGKDFFTIKYSPSGKEHWTKDFNGSGVIGRNNDVAKAVIVDAKGRIYVMGETMGEDTELDFCLIRYSEYFSGPPDTIDASNNFTLGDNFPNPFNPSTKISFTIPVYSNIKLAVYDISGREVALLVNQGLPAGPHEYNWDASQYASGTYFYKIHAGSFVQTKKMLLIK